MILKDHEVEGPIQVQIEVIVFNLILFELVYMSQESH